MYYENTIINGVTGAHVSESNSVSDVTKLVINNQVMLYVPSNLIKTFENVVSIEIDGSGLQKVSHIDGQKEVVIINNNIPTIDSNSFSGSPDVESVILYGNQIQKITDGAFDNNKEIITFDISNNLIENFTSTSIQTILQNGANINLSNNQLSNVIWSYSEPTESQITATGNPCIDGKSGKNKEAFVKELQDGCSSKDELECEFKFSGDGKLLIVTFYLK